MLCPRGDFIADMTLSVVDGQFTTRWGRSAKDLRRRKLQQRPALYADVVVAGDKNVVPEIVAKLPTIYGILGYGNPFACP